MSEVATPAESVETPAPAATPAPAPAATPAPAVPVAETVTLTKEQHDQLARDAARAAGNQRKADLYDRHFGQGGRFQPPTPATPPSAEQMRETADAEDRKAERGLTAIAASPEFREVLDADPTLRDLMVKNPLAVLPLLAPDAMDADDAIGLVKDALKARVKPAPAPAPATPPAPTPEVPKPGAVTTPTDQTVHEAVEDAKKIPNTERAIANMIGAKIGLGK